MPVGGYVLAPSCLGCCLVCALGLCGACPPHFVQVELAAGCLTSKDGHHSHLWRLDAVPLACGVGLYPRPRVLHLLSTTPNEAMRVFDCVLA